MLTDATRLRAAPDDELAASHLRGAEGWRVPHLLAERRRKLTTARELRKQENIKLRQSAAGGLPYPVEDSTRRAAQTILDSERRFVSL